MATAQPQSPPGLRARKAARTRLAIVEALNRRLAESSLDAIGVDELAAAADVSRVTFFNYFPAKRHAVDLLVTVHVLGMEAEVRRQGLRGVEAIEWVFGHYADEMREAPDRWRRVFGHFAVGVPRERTELTRAERLQLWPDVADELPDVASVGWFLMGLIDEAVEDGIELPGSSYEVAHFIGSLLNGATITGGTSPDTDYAALLRRHARRALGLLGAEGQRDPKPPRIPKPYRKKRSRK